MRRERSELEEKTMDNRSSVMFSALIRCLATAVCYLAWPGTSWPQEYPAKAVRILVGFAPGGGIDLVARVAAQKLSSAFGQTLVVENRTGASGNIAAEFVAKAAPDGYTLLFGNSSLSISPAVFHKLAYDPLRDLMPISMVSSLPFVLVVHPSLPVRSVRELVALAKAKPGALDYASAGAGTMSHLAMELMRLKTGIKITHLPYKGSHPAWVGLMSGEAQCSFLGIPIAYGQVNAGKLRGLGITAKTRSSVLSQVPTMHEAGVAGYEVLQWNGLFAPARTPQPVLDRLYRELAKAVATAEVRQRLEHEGADPVGSTPGDFSSFLRVDAEKWADVAKRSGTRLD